MAQKWGRLYEDPEELRRVLEGYFSEADAHTQMELTRNAGLVEVPAPLPYTVADMQLATGLMNQTWHNYRTYPGFDEVLAWAYKKLEAQWGRLTARPSNNGGAIFYMANVFKGEYTSQMNVNMGGQPGNPVTTVQRTDKDRLADCTVDELEAIERILMEAEKREKA